MAHAESCPDNAAERGLTGREENEGRRSVTSWPLSGESLRFKADITVRLFIEQLECQPLDAIWRC